MDDINVRSDAVDVEQIMRQIRGRIREKRGTDYTEAELQQLATVKLEAFLDPRGVRSDLVAQFRAQRVVPPAPPNYEFGENTLFETHRGALAGLRKLFKPLLKLFFNPDRLTSALHLQAEINTQAEQRLRRLEEREPIYYELIHNLTIEATRLGIEVHNLKMRVESLSSRMDFDERRARSLESVVQYRAQPSSRPGHQGPTHSQSARPEPAPPAVQPPAAAETTRPDGPAATDGPQGEQRRRRRRRRRRRPGQTFADGQQGASRPADGGGPAGNGQAMQGDSANAPDDVEQPADDADGGDDGDGEDFPGPVKLAVVVQRYGAEISGGAELHARYIAERLTRHADVEVLTTCAKDYITWADELPPGEERVRGVRVRRFPVAHPRDTNTFGRLSQRVFERAHSIADELRWLDSEGPASQELTRYVAQHEPDFDFFVFFSYRYYHAWHGARAVSSKAVIVPTAERDAAIGLGIFPPVLRGVRALMYNSLEERALIDHVSGRTGPGVVVGVGSEIPERTQPWRFRKAFNVRKPFAIYIGRIDENKGCTELFSHFERYAAMYPHGLDLVLVGSEHLRVPTHPRIRHLGFLPDEDKFDALAAADVLIMPSRFESLSMVALEAWAVGKPVLVNGHCDVLRGQAIRSNAGLYYDTFEEFAEALYLLEATGPLGGVLGRNGREFFRRNYAWPVIERKYLDMFERLKREPPPPPMAPLPGWWPRRKRTERPGEDVLSSAPKGPVTRA